MCPYDGGLEVFAVAWRTRCGNQAGQGDRYDFGGIWVGALGAAQNDKGAGGIVGEQLRREFSMSPVDTGQMTPPVDIPGASMPGAPPGMPTQIPGQPIHRPSFLQAFLANLGPSLAGGLPAYGPQGEQSFGTGLAGG